MQKFIEDLSVEAVESRESEPPRKIIFSVINIINHVIPALQALPSESISHDTIKEIIDQQFNYVQTSVQQELLHLQFMPINAEQQIQGDSYYQSRLEIRSHMQLSANKNQVVTVNLRTLQTLHQFGAKPLPFANTELNALCAQSFNDLQINSASSGYNVKMSFMPVGLQFQACWLQDQWILASKTFARINEIKSEGCDLNMIQLLEFHLKSCGISMEHMNKSHIYTFLLSRSEFNKWIPMQNQLYLLSVFDTVSKGAIEDDQIKKSSISRIYSTSFKCSEQMSFKQYRSMISNNCNVLDSKNPAFSRTKPVGCIIIKTPSGALYELETDCGALIKLINKWEHSKLNIKECIKQQQKENQYAQQIQQSSQGSPENQDSFITRSMFRQMPAKRCQTADAKE